MPEHRLSEANELARATIDSAVKVGMPTDTDTTIGPMVTQKQFERVQEYIRIGIEEGATLLTGGMGKPAGFEAGNFVKATVFTNVKNSMRSHRRKFWTCAVDHPLQGRSRSHRHSQ